MRILVVYDVAYPFTNGGGQKRIWEVAVRVARQGHDVDWLCFKTWSGKQSLLQMDGINYIGMDGFKGLYKKNGKRRVNEPIEFFYALLRKNISLNAYDVIWLGQWPLSHALYFLLFRKFNRKKIFIDWWEVWGKTWMSYSPLVGWAGYFLEKFLLSIVCRNANLILISEKAKNFLGNKNGVSKNLVSLIPNGINYENLSGIEIKPKKFKLVYFGRLQQHKNVDLLIESIAFIRKKYDYDVNLRIVGNGPEKVRLLNAVENHLVEDLVEIISDSNGDSEFYSLISEALIFVNPSTKEGGGSITTLEAFGLGLPVIGFECRDGIDPSLLQEDRGGVLVREVSAFALGNAIHELLIDKDRIDGLSKNAKNFSSKCDWNTVAQQYVDLFRQVREL